MKTKQNQNIYEYVWIDGSGNLRSKSRVLDGTVDPLDVPQWNYDGSSTGQARADNSEITIVPVRTFISPFKYSNFLVLCETYDSDGQPALKNNRHKAVKIFEEHRDAEPWYGLEQEYFIFENNMHKPLGFDASGVQGQYYCSVGSLNSYGRTIAEKHMMYCLEAGIKISGINAEVAPGQWEFQIGPVEGVDAADQLWIARYILEKITEDYGVNIVYDPKPLLGDWNGSGCHTNFSTNETRQDGGYDKIISFMEKLKVNHHEHMKVYGENNHTRMSGLHETSNYDDFSYGVANRQASVRIPTETKINGYGYFEDRRPAANIDPYQVTSIILETIMSDLSSINDHLSQKVQ